MTRPITIAAAAAAAVLTFGIAAPANAAGHEGSGDSSTLARGSAAGKKPVLDQLQIADSTLLRISKSGPISGLADDNRSVVLDHVEADRVVLAKMRKVVERTTSPATLNRVQNDIKKFHTQNYTDIAYLLDDSEDLLWAVDQCRRNLEADATFSPADRASLNSRLDAVRARMQATAAGLLAVTARSDESKIRKLDKALSKAESDLDKIDSTIYSGGSYA
jgi:hypothetical protein